MREIKFRAWDKKKKIMYTNVSFSSDDYCPRRITSSDIDILEFVNHNDCELMQFTGLKDTEGKELYHKDSIMNYSRNAGQPHNIEWSDKKGAWVGVYRNLEYLIAEELYEIKKCGNIYEGATK